MEFSLAGSDELLTLWTSTMFNTKLLFYTFKNILTTNHNLGHISSPESSTLLSRRLC